MALPSVSSRVGITIILLLGLGCWVISLAGLAKLTDLCRKNETISEWAPFNIGALEKSSMVYSCGVKYSLHWWIVSLEFFAIVLALLASLVNWFNAGKQCVISYMVIATTLYCLFAESYIQGAYFYKDASGNDYAKATKAAAAGAIGVLTCNFLFLALLGRDVPGAVDGKGPMGATIA